MTVKDWLGLIVQLGMAVAMAGLGIERWRVRRNIVEQDAIGRLERLERDFQRIRDKASDEADKWQKGIGDMTAGQARLDERINFLLRERLKG